MEIKYYTNRRGDNKILDFIKKLNNKKYQRSIISKLDKLEENGIYKLQSSHDVSKVNKNPDIYELRASYGKTIFRLLFGLIDNIYLMVVIFRKKNQKIPKQYIDLAIKRIKE